MGVPQNLPTVEESQILQDMTDQLGQRFIQLVKTNRKMSSADLKRVASARIYLADDALDLGLIDRIGYLNDAIQEAQQMADLPADARVVVYRRVEYPDDNLYNPMASGEGTLNPSLIRLGLPASTSELSTGFHYLWAPAVGKE